VAGTKPPETTVTEAPLLTATDLVMPEGMAVDDKLKTEFIDLLNDKNLKPVDRANKLIDLQKRAQEAQMQSTRDAFVKMNEDWQKETTDDKEIGGDKLPGVLAGISKVLDKYGSQEVRQIFDITGVGNNVHVARMMHKIAMVLNEPGFVGGQPPGQVQSAASLIYDNTRS